MNFQEIAANLGQSDLLKKLSSYYTFAPSAIIIRVAEAEILRAAPFQTPVLDLCCGDGFFGTLVRPEGFDAGCDIDFDALQHSHKSGKYTTIACNDVTATLSFPDNSFQTIVSNSSLEHVEDIDTTLQECQRVLRPGGRLYMTLPSHYTYQWWQLGDEALEQYLKTQPIYNCFPIEEWQQRFEQAGLQYVQHQYYLSKTATRWFSFLDYRFSQYYLGQPGTATRLAISLLRKMPFNGRILPHVWQWLFSRIKILANDAGGGILLVSEKHVSP